MQHARPIAWFFVLWSVFVMAAWAGTASRAAHFVAFPSRDLLRNLPYGTPVLSMNDYGVTIMADRATLRAAGAWFILPTRTTGCLGG